jgi:hypothetical protein
MKESADNGPELRAVFRAIVSTDAARLSNSPKVNMMKDGAAKVDSSSPQLSAPRSPSKVNSFSGRLSNEKETRLELDMDLFETKTVNSAESEAGTELAELPSLAMLRATGSATTVVADVFSANKSDEEKAEAKAGNRLNQAFVLLMTSPPSSNEKKSSPRYQRPSLPFNNR